MQQNVPEFPALLRGTQRTALHLEMRDQYGVAGEAEDFQAWKDGHRPNPLDRDSWWTPWCDMINLGYSTVELI